jgi:hypothetical protein
MLSVDRQLRRLVRGGIADTFHVHPDYLTRKGRRSAEGSLVKRICGTIKGYVEQSTRGRSGTGTQRPPAADEAAGTFLCQPPREGAVATSPPDPLAELDRLTADYERARKRHEGCEAARQRLSAHVHTMLREGL